MAVQVALFGAVSAEKDWRNNQVIPLLKKLNVTYFNPVVDNWTPERAPIEAQAMADAETIIMVFDNSSPAFTGLAEAGWAALGASQRGQNFILYIDMSYKLNIPESIITTDLAVEWSGYFKHWASSVRELTYRHAQESGLETLHLCDTMDKVCDKLKEIYG